MKCCKQYSLFVARSPWDAQWLSKAGRVRLVAASRKLPTRFATPHSPLIPPAWLLLGLVNQITWVPCQLSPKLILRPRPPGLDLDIWSRQEALPQVSYGQLHLRTSCLSCSATASKLPASTREFGYRYSRLQSRHPTLLRRITHLRRCDLTVARSFHNVRPTAVVSHTRTLQPGSRRLPTKTSLVITNFTRFAVSYMGRCHQQYNGRPGT